MTRETEVISASDYSLHCGEPEPAVVKVVVASVAVF
jgi:hypothetical protein